MTLKGFGKRLQKAFKSCNLSQQEVAISLDVSRQQVSNWCREVCAPSFLILIKIMELTHKDANYFFGLPSCTQNPAKFRKGLLLIRQALEELEGEC